MSTDDAMLSDLLYKAAVAQTNSMLTKAQANADGVISTSEQLAVDLVHAEAVTATVAAVRVAAAVVWRAAETVGVEVSSAAAVAAAKVAAAVWRTAETTGCEVCSTAAVKEGPMRAAPDFAADCPPRCAPK